MAHKYAAKKTTESLAKAHEMLADGATHATIAQALGIHRWTLRNWFKCDGQRNVIKYKSKPLFNIQQRLRIGRVQAKRRGYTACTTTPEIILEAYTGYCECCERHEDDCGILYIDHCHTSGVFRAWLCSKYNRGMGFLNNPKLLRRAAEILER